MPGPSADERIKRFLKRRAQESALAEVASQEHRKRERQEHDEREQQHEQIIERIKAKWTADVDLIAAILAELQAKLADEDLEVRFQDICPTGDAIVRGLITGRFLGQPINVTLNVYASGIELHKAGPTGGYLNEEFASASKLSILNAGKGEYEALILDLLGIAIRARLRRVLRLLPIYTVGVEQSTAGVSLISGSASHLGLARLAIAGQR